jgi:hypothetical protein
VHRDVDGALGDAVFRLLLLGRRRRRPGVPGPAAAFAAGVESVVAAGAAAWPQRARGPVALRRGVGGLQNGRRLPPAQLRRLGPGRGQLLVLGLRGGHLVVEVRHGRGLEGQALPEQLQSLLLLFLQVQKCTQFAFNKKWAQGLWSKTKTVVSFLKGFLAFIIILPFFLFFCAYMNYISRLDS